MAPEHAACGDEDAFFKFAPHKKMSLNMLTKQLQINETTGLSFFSSIVWKPRDFSSDKS